MTPGDTWLQHAACRTSDVNLFFSPEFIEWDPECPPRELKNEKRKRETAAKNVCATCAVKLACLTDVLDYEGTVGHRARHGVWAGLNEDERATLADRQLTAQERRRFKAAS